MADDLRAKIIQAMADANTPEAWEAAPANHVPLAAYADAVLEIMAHRLRVDCHLCDWPRPIDLDRHWHAAHLAKPEEPRG